jgi:nucleoside phosphorylase
MLRSFPIKFGLMVGVGGGVWSKENDIRLGDIVVSQPTGTHGGVVQWDFGKTERHGKFRRTGSLDKPPPVLLHALQELKLFDETDGVELEKSLALIIRNKPRMAQKYQHQGMENDVLFKAEYDHDGDETCDGCDAEWVVQRPARKDTAPRIHYGNIASGNMVMKHGTTRDKIANEEGIICFEMEAAGLMDNFRCLVIEASVTMQIRTRTKYGNHMLRPRLQHLLECFLGSSINKK